MLRFEGSHPTFDKKCPYWQNNISDTTKRSCYDWWYCSKCNCTYIIATPHQLRLKEKNAQHTDMYHRMYHNQSRNRHIWKRQKKEFNLIRRFPSDLLQSTTCAGLATRSATTIPIFHCQSPPVNERRCQPLTLRRTHRPLPRGKLCYSPYTHLESSLGWFGISEYRIEGIHWARQRNDYCILAHSNSEIVDRLWEWCNRPNATHVV